MNTITDPNPTPDGVTRESSGQIDISATQRVPFTRLVSVEARKMADTRGGFWLMLVTGLLLAVFVAIVLLVVALNDDFSMSANTWSMILTIPLSLLLPVFAILTVTSEWSQRTGLGTFTLEPHRLRVFRAKLVSVALLALATIVVAVILGAIGNVVGAAIGGYDAQWDFSATDLLITIGGQLAYFMMGFALALLILNTPGAIAIYYVVALLLPLMVYQILFFMFDWARDLIPFIDMQYATAPLLQKPIDLSGTDVLALISAVTLWVVLPLVIGIRRVLRAEVK